MYLRNIKEGKRGRKRSIKKRRSMKMSKSFKKC